jgi:hypothetical protein
VSIRLNRSIITLLWTTARVLDRPTSSAPPRVVIAVVGGDRGNDKGKNNRFDKGIEHIKRHEGVLYSVNVGLLVITPADTPAIQPPKIPIIILSMERKGAIIIIASILGI